jgi:hypothetical protein
MPSVGVVIPVLNGAEHIGITLGCVVNQSHRPADVVVVDDGCTDDTVAVAGSFEGVRVVTNPRPGLDAARAFGLSQIDTDLVVFLDHDDPWHSEHLRLMVQALAAHPEACAAVSHARPFQDGTNPGFDPPLLDAVLADPWDLFPGCFTRTPSGVVMRRVALDDVGGWSTAFWPTGELYMWLRLFEWGPFVVNGPSTVGYRVRQRSLSVQQRRDSAEGFVEAVASAAEDAVRARAARFPEEAEVLSRRGRVATAVRHLGMGVFRGDRSEIARGAALLEEGTRGEPVARAQRAFDPLFWLVDGHAASPGVESDVWRPLIDGWPTAARSTAPYRLPYTSMRALLRSALREPAAAWRWRWLIEVARMRLRGDARP